MAAEPEHCDLQAAEYDPSLSGAGEDEDSSWIFTTVDRVSFRPIPGVVERVLDANGFALNLENILASLDEARIGYRVELSSTSLPPGAIPPADRFLPALTLRLPAKHRVGPLLGKFYAEVEAYQSELIKLREEKGRARGGDRQAASARAKELERLQEQNALLQKKLDDMSLEMAALRQAHAEATSALKDQNLLPAQVRLAQVHDVDLATRNVELKSGRKIFSIPLVALWVYPEKSDPCLVSIQDGQVSGVFFHEGSQAPPGMILADVLHVADGKVKIRDDQRRTRVIEAQNLAEVELINQMRRGDRVLLFLHEGALIRFTPCGTFDPEAFVRAVQESIARFEITSTEGSSDGTGTSE
ncbi:MAG: hypothetical protein AAFZ18_02800 [Myxococcota bacterium]